MRTTTANLIRLAVMAAVLGVAVAQTAQAQRTAPTPRGTVATASRSDRPPHAADSHENPEDRPGDPMAGILWISGAVALLIFLAWLAMRVGDSDRPADGIPN